MGLVVETREDIGVTRLSRWIFNCYLIHDGGDGRPLVVDPGLPGVIDDLLPLMDRLGLAPDGLSALCATHAHSDHVGGAPALASRAKARVHLPEPSRAYLEGSTPRSPRPKAIARIWPAAFDQPLDARGVADAARGSRVAGYGTGAGMRWPNEVPIEYLADGEHLPGAPDGWSSPPRATLTTAPHSGIQKCTPCCRETPCYRLAGAPGSLRKRWMTRPAPGQASASASWTWPTFCPATGAPFMVTGSPSTPWIRMRVRLELQPSLDECSAACQVACDVHISRH